MKGYNSGNYQNGSSFNIQKNAPDQINYIYNY